MLYKGSKIVLLAIAFATIAWFRTLLAGQTIDHWVYEQAIGLSQSKAWLWIWMGVTLIGYGEVVDLLVGLTVLLGLVRHRNWQWFAAMMLCWLAFSANPYLKSFFHTARPQALLDVAHLASYSFPSGHAFNSVLLFYLLPRLWFLQKSEWPTQNRVLSWRVWLPGVVLISASRLFLGAHWVNDVVAGALHGFIWSEIILIVLLEAPGKKKDVNDA